MIGGKEKMQVTGGLRDNINREVNEENEVNEVAVILNQTYSVRYMGNN